MSRKPLGRGLGALLSAEQQSSSEGSYEVPIESIRPSGVQPRISFDHAKLQELAKSIESNGVVQPLLVRRQGLAYELIAGERRWRAAQLAGLTQVPVLVRDVADEKLLELALIENIQREDLNPIEEAHAYKNLIDGVGLTQESLGARIGRDRSYVTNFLRLLRLPADIQQLIASGKLSSGHGRTLLAINEIDAQRRIARRIIERGLSVRETERIVRALEVPRLPRKSQPKSAAPDPNIRAAETKLRRYLGTQVRISQSGGEQNGKIEIEFYGSSDLIRIFRLLLPIATSAGG
jgi:ParB family transcriptional regulator, chromosome partitioning protein